MQPGDEYSGCVAVQRHHLVDIGAADPGPFPGARKDDGPGPVIRGDPRQGITYLHQRGGIEDVESFGTGNGQPVDRTSSVLLDIYVQRVGGAGLREVHR